MELTTRVDDGADVETELQHLALVNYGHFTAMQVRGGLVRGLAHHVARLRGAHRELYGSDLPPDTVRIAMRRAAAAQPDSYVRITVYEATAGVPCMVATVRDPVDTPAAPVTLMPVSYERPFPHIKHVGTFAQIRHGILAERAGFDDALLITADGRVSETTMANIGFVRGRTITWPDAPCLHGITWQLLDAVLARHGYAVRVEAVRLDEIGRFESAFLTNSVGVGAVGRIGTISFAADHPVVADVQSLYTDIPWDDFQR